MEETLSAPVYELDLEGLYRKSYPPVARFIGKMGGSMDDARDIFQDSIIIFHEKQNEESLKIETTPEAYIFGIAKHLWNRKFRRHRPTVPLDEADKEIVIPQDFYSPPIAGQVFRLLASSGRRCLELLQAFYYEQMEIGKIVSMFGFSGEHSASVQKYKCLEKIRNKVKEQSISYGDLVE